MNNQILFEDKEILVCRKPSGLPVQSGRIGAMDLESLLNRYLKERGGREGIRLIHRLDQTVEGILVFGKTKGAAAGLNRQLQEGVMEKRYLAVCCPPLQKEAGGGVQKDFIEVSHMLLKDSRTNMSRIVPEGTKGAKQAKLFCRRVGEETPEGLELLEIRLLTGRHHQIRVQMAGMGMPLYGDRKYNPRWEEWAKAAGESSQDASLALCAFKLAFPHPVSGKKMEFSIRPSGRVFERFHEI